VRNNLVNKTASIIKKGGVVIFPTATVYGLGCDCGNPRAVRKIYRIKGRSWKKPLVLMLSSKSQLEKLPIKIQAEIKRNIKKIWPGPVTFIIKCEKSFAKQLNSKNGTLALRLADHPVTKKIISSFGGFLATSSANFSGEMAAADFSEIPQKLLKIADFAIDGGRTRHQLPSTIVDLTAEKPVILRAGAMNEKIILKTLTRS